MRLLSWNCQGLGAALTKKNLRFLLYKYKPQLVFLMETRHQKNYIENIQRRLRYQHAVYVDLVGLSGGLCLWWTDGAQIDVIDMDKNCIHVLIRSGVDGLSGFVTLVYGPPTFKARVRWLRELQRLNPGPDIPWVCIGDFNDMLYCFEKEGGRILTDKRTAGFHEFIQEAGLIDLGYKGLKYTWANNRAEGEFIRERIDRALCNITWHVNFLHAQVVVLDPIGSDHSPLILSTDQQELKIKRPFKFEAMWIDHPDLIPIIESNWTEINETGEEGLKSFIANLDRVQKALIKWSKKEFGNCKAILSRLLEELNACYAGEWNADKARCAESLTTQIEELWNREEVYWAQRSRIQWLKWGDQNSKFFHTSTIIRRQRNKIGRLKNENGDWMDDMTVIERSFIDFYQDLFDTVGQRSFDKVLEYVKPVIDEEMNSRLMCPISSEEVKAAAFELGSLKAPGPDGFPGMFNHKSWHVVGPKFCNLVKSFFTDDLKVDYLNETNLVMIPFLY